MSVVIDAVRYSSGGKPVAMPSSRRVVKVFPEGGQGPYDPDTNSVIRIELAPSLGFLDTHNSYLSFRVRTKSGTVDHTKECRMDKNSMSWLKTFTIMSSTGAQLEHLEHHNLLLNLLHKTTGGPVYSNSIGKMIDNYGDRAARNAAMAHPQGSVYNSGFDVSGILNGESGKLIPLSFLQGPLMLELTMAPMKECFVYSDAQGQTGSYQVTDIEYHAHVLSFSEEYNAKFSQQYSTAERKPLQGSQERSTSKRSSPRC